MEEDEGMLYKQKGYKDYLLSTKVHCNYDEAHAWKNKGQSYENGLVKRVAKLCK